MADLIQALSKSRLRHRQGDASDADVSIYEIAAPLWEPCSPNVARMTHQLNSDRTVEEVVRQAQSAIVDPPHVA